MNIFWNVMLTFPTVKLIYQNIVMYTFYWFMEFSIISEFCYNCYNVTSIYIYKILRLTQEPTLTDWSKTQYFTLSGLFHVEFMEWGVDCKNSRWIPWFFQIDSICLVGGFHGISRWIPYGMSSWNHNFTLITKFKPKYWVVWNKW